MRRRCVFTATFLENNYTCSPDRSLKTSINCLQYLEGRQPGRDLHLDRDAARLDALERDGGDPLDHAQSRYKPKRRLEHFPLIMKHIRNCGSNWHIRRAERRRVDLRCGSTSLRPSARRLFGAAP